MINIYIKYPIWATRSIGINHRTIKDDLMIEILYKDVNGFRLYPDVYYLRKDKALKYPIQIIDSQVKLHIIPISELEALSQEEIEYAKYCQSQGIYFNRKI